MRIFLDTGNPEDVRKLRDEHGFLVDGVTTNPSLLARAGGNRSYRDVIRAFSYLGVGDVSAETIGCPDYDRGKENVITYLEEARILWAVDPNVVTVKIPLTPVGMEAVHLAEREGIRTNTTLCFGLPQAIAAGKRGAKYVSPFIGRLYDRGADGIYLVQAILDAYKSQGVQTQVLTASVRTTQQVAQAYELGSHVATLPFGVVMTFIENDQLERLKGMQDETLERHGISIESQLPPAELTEELLWAGMDAFLRDGKDARVRERILASAVVA